MQPTHNGSPKAIGRAVLIRYIFGLAVHKVCHARSITAAAVGSYPTFSPLPPPRVAVYFLRHFL